VREGDWKLVFPHPGRTYEGFQPGKEGMPGTVNENFPVEGALYDLRRDPGERYDVSESNPDIVQSLERVANEARVDLGDDLMKMEGENRRKAGKVNPAKTVLQNKK
jgi:arylsulfatase